MNLHYELFVDYDGVLVDFHAGVKNLTGYHYKDPHWKSDPKLRQERTKQIESAGPQWWATLPPMPDYEEIWNFVFRYDPHILTAMPSWKGGEQVAEHADIGKRAWNEKYTKRPHHKFHVVTRDSKKYFARNEHGPNILIDDFDQNINAWRGAGGIAIHHTNARDTIDRLRLLGYT